MGNLTEVKTTFTIDLAPYLEGLKSMLTMTQQTGVQLKPLLNMQIGKADFSQLEKSFQSYNEKIKASIPIAGEVAQASTAIGAAAANEDTKVRKTSQSHEEHALTLRNVRRDSLQAFGAIAFLTQGIVTLASSNDQGNRKLQTLNQGLSQGISSGFGLAGILVTLGITTMGVGAAIGAAVAVGVTLLKFLDDGTDKTVALEKATKGFSNTLRGASLQSLLEYRINLLLLIQDIKKKIAADEEHMRTMGQDTVAGAKTIDGLKQMRLALTGYTKDLEEIDAAMTAKQKTHAEWRDLIRTLELANITNDYDRQRAAAQKHYEDQFNELVRAAATAKDGNKIITALRAQLAKDLDEIDKAEQQGRVARITAFNDKEKQIDDASFEEKLSFIRISGMRLGITQGEIDTQVAAATVARKKSQLAVELSFTDQEDEDRKVRVANLLKDIAALQAQGALSEIEAEKQKASALKQLQRTADEARKAELENLNSIASNLSSAFGDVAQMVEQSTSKIIGEEKKQKEAALDKEAAKRLEAFDTTNQLQTLAEKERRDALLAATKSVDERKKLEQQFARDDIKIGLDTSTARKKIEDESAAAKSALDAEMDAKAKERNRAAFEIQKLVNIGQATMATYTAAALVLGPPPLGAGPIIGAFMAGAIIAAGLAQVAMIASQEVPGMAKGGRVSGPTLAMVGEAGPEIVAPEKSFIQVFKDDLAPRLIDVLLPQIKASVLAAIAVSGSGTAGVTIQIYIANYYGDEEHFDKVLKPAIEDAMRRAGVSTAAALFRNSQRAA